MENLYTSLDYQSGKWKSNVRYPFWHLKYFILGQLSVPVIDFCILVRICRDK